MNGTASVLDFGWASVRRIRIGSYRRGASYALVAGMALGTLGPLSSLAYATGMSSATFAALRATIGAAALVVFIRAAARPTISLRSLGARDRVLLTGTAVAQAVLSLAIFAAYEAMPVAAVLAVFFCYPLLVAGTSIALGRERLTVARALGLMVALGGLVTVLLGGTEGNVSISIAGIALAAVAAGAQAIYLVISRAGFARLPSDQASAIILAGAATLIWLVALPVDSLAGLDRWILSPAAWLIVGVAGVVGAAVAKALVLRAVRRIGGTRASVLMLSEPLAGVALAAILLGQSLSPWQAIGGVGVLVGAILVQRPAGIAVKDVDSLVPRSSMC